MADSCRPVSRHGRYNASGPSSVQYSPDVPSYGNMDYTPSDEMYTVNQPTRPERPRTSKGSRSKADIPPRPSSRRSRQGRRPDPNEESDGRPASRVGFSPEPDYRYSHDEYSRQISLEAEKQIQNSPNNSPEPQDIFNNDQQVLYQSGVLGTSPVQRDVLRDSPQSGKADRLIVSPSSPNVRNYRRSPQGYRDSPKGYRQSPQLYRQSPQGFRQSPQMLRQSPQGYSKSPQGFRQSPQGPSPHYVRPSSGDNMNVSPIQRDEAQIAEGDLHHISSEHHGNGQMNIHEGDRYQQRFQKSPTYGTSPYQDSSQYRESPQYSDSPQNMENSQYRDSPLNRESPQYRESSQYGASPPEQQHTYTRPLPSQRPKSARPKTGRKKSARVRHRHEEVETSQPQHCDTTSILNVGDPYGRPSSSLSPYKPLPSIGLATPRTPLGGDTGCHTESLQSQVDAVTVETHKLGMNSRSVFHPADNDYDTFSAEDIQGASSSNRDIFTGAVLPNVDMLTNLPQNLAGEIYEKSVLNFERNMNEGVGEGVADFENSGSTGGEYEDNIRSSEPTPLTVTHHLPKEPCDSEPRVLLAVKLPDGKRIQRYFRPNETLGTILHFAENASHTDFSDYWLVCNAPKITFVDLSQAIEDTPIQDRTALYLEEKE